MKIALAQQNYHIGNFEDNTRKIIGAIQYAKSRGADLVVFSELSICGYPPRDLLEFNDFVNECYKAIDIIKEHTDTIGVIVGCPQRNPEKEGKDLFNAGWFLYEKQVLGVAQKTCLPTYDVFDENRYFEPAYHWEVIRFKGKRIALTICEDIWNLGDDPLYRINPMDKLIVQQPDLMINISASPFDYDHDDDRLEVIRANVMKYKLPMFYCNTIGSQTEVVFDGGSLVMDAQGASTAANGFRELLLRRLKAGIEQQLRHAEHPIHRRADLMAHVGQKLALRAVGFVGCCRGRAQRQRRLAFVLDIPNGAGERGLVQRTFGRCRSPRPEPAVLAIPPSQSKLQIERTALFQVGAQAFFKRFLILVVQKLLEHVETIRQLQRLVAQEVAKARREPHLMSRDIQFPDTVLRAPNCPIEARLRFVLLGDVLDSADDTLHNTVHLLGPA